MNLNTIRTGDLIVREKGPLSTHYIVWIGWKHGIQTVAENDATYGVRYTSLEKALDGKPIKRFEKFGGTEAQRFGVKQQINRLLGRSYDLVAFNCEHFARFIATGKMESKQVKVASNLLLVTGGLLMTSRNSSARTFGAILLILGGLGWISQLLAKPS